MSPCYSPATDTVPCAALWYDARAYGRPIYDRVRMQLLGQHDGWKPCTAAGTELVEVDGCSRLMCADHARQTFAVLAAGMAGRLRWRT